MLGRVQANYSESVSTTTCRSRTSSSRFHVLHRPHIMTHGRVTFSASSFPQPVHLGFTSLATHAKVLTAVRTYLLGAAEGLHSDLVLMLA